MAGQLIVSISGIRDRTLGDVADFCAELDARRIPASLLVAPRLKGGYRLERDIPTVEWLTKSRAAGAAVVLHGFDEAASKKRRGEFAALPAHEANLRPVTASTGVGLGLPTIGARPPEPVSTGCSSGGCN